jgi:hypothetical protein
MKDKQLIRLVKNALKREHLYDPAEIQYMKRQMDSAILRKKRKKFIKNNLLTEFNETDSKTDSSNT